MSTTGGVSEEPFGLRVQPSSGNMEPSYLSSPIRAEHFLECFTNNLSSLHPTHYADFSVHEPAADGRFGVPFIPLLRERQDRPEGVTHDFLQRLAGAISSGQLAGFHGEIDLSRNPLSDRDVVELLQATRTTDCVTGRLMRVTGTKKQWLTIHWSISVNRVVVFSLEVPLVAEVKHQNLPRVSAEPSLCRFALERYIDWGCLSPPPGIRPDGSHLIHCS